VSVCRPLCSTNRKLFTIQQEVAMSSIQGSLRGTFRHGKEREIVVEVVKIDSTISLGNHDGEEMVRTGQFKYNGQYYWKDQWGRCTNSLTHRQVTLCYDAHLLVKKSH